ncbi:MAG: hypothetical protein ACM3XM_13850 [Mycobacterium leprae]
MVKRLAALCFLTFMLTACSTESGQEELRFSRVSYHLTGGIGGFDRQIQIGSDGSFSITELGKPGPTGTLSTAEMNQLRKAIGRVDWGQINSRYVNPRVADAMFEALTVQIKGVEHRTLVSTGGLPPAELQAVTETLRQILDSHWRDKSFTPHRHGHGG